MACGEDHLACISGWKINFILSFYNKYQNYFKNKDKFTQWVIIVMDNQEQEIEL